MNRIYYLFLLLSVACSSTRITKLSSAPKIVRGEGILMLKMNGLSDIDQYRLYQSGHEIISESNQMKFVSELEYDLLSKGISIEQVTNTTASNPLISTIAKETGSRYILIVEYVSSTKGGTFGSYTDLDLQGYNSHYYQDNETNSASLIFKLIDAEFPQIESKFQIKTKINPLIIDENKGETRINPTTEMTAITKAFEKGMKYLKKNAINK